ncbi:hypothetical protein EGP64_03985 [bacterium]|nr:hypothetical protein [bacterium]
MKKMIIGIIIGVIIGVIISGTIGVLASTIISSTNVTNQNKTVNIALDELYNEAITGKELVAAAITNKGITTTSSDTYETMAKNIDQIISSTVEVITIPFSGRVAALLDWERVGIPLETVKSYGISGDTVQDIIDNYYIFCRNISVEVDSMYSVYFSPDQTKIWETPTLIFFAFSYSQKKQPTYQFIAYFVKKSTVD